MNGYDGYKHNPNTEKESVPLGIIEGILSDKNNKIKQLEKRIEAIEEAIGMKFRK